MKNKRFYLNILFILLVYFLFLATAVQAKPLLDSLFGTEFGQELKFEPNISIPGTEFNQNTATSVINIIKSTDQQGNVIQVTDGNLAGRYIASLYKFLIGISGILAVFMITVGGFMWIFSGGSSEKVSKAKEVIFGAVIGLVLALGSYLILYTVNPQLVNFDLAIPVIQDDLTSGCCELIDNSDKSLVHRLAIYFDENSSPAPKTSCYLMYKKQIRKGNYTFGEFLLEDWSIPFRVIVDNILNEGEFTVDTVEWHPDTEGMYWFPQSVGRNVECIQKRTEGWLFDPGVRQQMSDASPQLADFLSCMRVQLNAIEVRENKKIGRISSISDSNHIGDLLHCENNASCDVTGKGCVHTCGSCHYGGGLQDNKSHAVDFGDEENKKYLEDARDLCGNIGFTLDEGNHLHMSTIDCPADGG